MAASSVGEIRQGVAADAAAIRDLTRAAYARWVRVIGREPVPMAADYDAALRTHRFDLIDVEDVLAALIETVVKDDHLHIENVAVLPRFQGRGLGRRMLAHAEGLASSLGFDVVKLHTNKLFDDNVRLYQRLGYRVDQEVAFRDGLVVYMSKRIAG
jgi:ribosomal protein S18 acetylase RimI-like enzyme